MTLATTAPTAAAAASDPTLGSFGGHGAHLLVLVAVWAVALVSWELRARGAARTVLLAVSTTGLSGCIHLLVVPEHLAESTAYGVFFLALALAQLAWCWAYRRTPDHRLLEAGGLATLLVVALWAETRFVGVGLGPLESGTEAIGWHDVASTVLELVLVVMALRSVVARRRAAAPATVELAAAGLPGPAAHPAAG